MLKVIIDKKSVRTSTVSVHTIACRGWKPMLMCGRLLSLDPRFTKHMLRTNHRSVHKKYMSKYFLNLSKFLILPSVLWHCWLGITKSIWPVKIEWRGVGVVICLERGADCLHMVQLMPLPSRSSLTSFKSRLVLPIWCQLTQVVLEKRPLNGCST